MGFAPGCDVARPDAPPPETKALILAALHRKTLEESPPSQEDHTRGPAPRSEPEDDGMFFLLYPLVFFVGLTALAIPVIIHLLNRRRYDVVDWGAMQFLQISET